MPIRPNSLPIRPNSLANLKPARRGDVRNPTGRNQHSKDRERRQGFRAICKAIDEGSEEVGEEILGKLAALVCEGAIAGEKRLLLPLLDREWPVPGPKLQARASYRSRSRAARWGNLG